jgi:Uma2 family endonuclease
MATPGKICEAIMTAIIEAIDDIYPDSDGKPMAETGIHVLTIYWLYGMLRQHFHARDDVYIAANMFLYYVEGQPKKRRSPDVMVCKGVKGRHERRSFKTWVEGVAPSCIIEVTSKKTWREDLQQKKPVYKKLGVREYFLFDPLHDYLPRQLLGFRLIGNKYKSIKPRLDGSILSKELGMHLRPDGTKVALYDSKTGVRLLNPDELLEINEDNEKQLEEERRRNAELQAELARLKRMRNGHSR